MRVDLLRVNKIEAVQVGQDVCRLLEYTMKLTEGNSNSVNESNLVSMWLRLEEPYRGPAAEKGRLEHQVAQRRCWCRMSGKAI